VPHSRRTTATLPPHTTGVVLHRRGDGTLQHCSAVRSLLRDTHPTRPTHATDAADAAHATHPTEASDRKRVQSVACLRRIVVVLILILQLLLVGERMCPLLHLWPLVRERPLKRPLGDTRAMPCMLPRE